jgi:hypothetical protein
MMQDLQYTL